MNAALTSRALATELLAAYDGATLAPTITSRGSEFSMVDAFAVADEARALRLARGERTRGYKIGFTNRSIWPVYGVHEPIWGPVWNTTTQLLDGALAATTLAGLSQPRIEPEIAFGFATAPRAGMTLAELAGSLEWVAHSFEIVHTHFEAWRFKAADTVADFALHGRLFIGPRVPVGRFVDLAAELATLTVELRRDGEPVDRGEGRIVLDGQKMSCRRRLHRQNRE